MGRRSVVAAGKLAETQRPAPPAASSARSGGTHRHCVPDASLALPDRAHAATASSPSKPESAKKQSATDARKSRNASAHAAATRRHGMIMTSAVETAAQPNICDAIAAVMTGSGSGSDRKAAFAADCIEGSSSLPMGPTPIASSNLPRSSTASETPLTRDRRWIGSQRLGP